MYDGGMRAALRHLRTLAAVRTATPLGDGELLGRFADTHDESAFAALVERHGPMVLRVCRRILGHFHDAEDACQATFLILARKAASIRKRGSAASWLYGVASRTARTLQTSRARRERACGFRDGALADAARDDLSWRGDLSRHGDRSWREVCAILDQELLRLPEKHRAPLVLCYLEGLTRDEAAQRLGLNLNRLRGRLDYGRGLLRRRLTRRGVALPAVLLASLLVREAPAAVPALLVLSTVKAAALTAAGRALPAALVSTPVVALTHTMVRAMFMTKLKVMFLALLFLAGLGTGVSAVIQYVAAAEAETPSAARRAPSAAEEGPPRSALGAPRSTPKDQTPAKPPKKDVHPFEKALEGLNKHYALADAEVLKCFRPPFPEERKAFFRAAHAPADGVEWDGNLTLHWRNGTLVFGSVTLGPVTPAARPHGRALEPLLTTLAGIYPQEVEGDADLRATLIDGDFVVREGAPPAKVIARLEEILNKDFNFPIKLTLRDEDRNVFVLSGKYKFTPVAPGREKNRIELYAQDLQDPNRGGGGSGHFDEFVRWLGRFINRRVVLGQAEGLPARLSWHDNERSPFTKEEHEADHAPGPIMQHVTDQTGLTLSEETRRVRVLVVERPK